MQMYALSLHVSYKLSLCVMDRFLLAKTRP